MTEVHFIAQVDKHVDPHRLYQLENGPGRIL